MPEKGKNGIEKRRRHAPSPRDASAEKIPDLKPGEVLPGITHIVMIRELAKVRATLPRMIEDKTLVKAAVHALKDIEGFRGVEHIEKIVQDFIGNKLSPGERFDLGLITYPTKR